MNERLLVIIVVATAAFLTYLGAPAAERLEVPQRMVSAALQFAAGTITALLEVPMVLVPLALGFLLTTVPQGIIPEANREGEPGFAGVLYIGGLSLYTPM